MKHFSLKTKYPQNYIIKRPLPGAVILFLFTFIFTLLYHPQSTHKSVYFSYQVTMFAYSLSSAAIAGLIILLLKKIPLFSKIESWTLGKEVLSILIVLQILGIIIYFLGFVYENTPIESRWNLPTFFDSYKNSILLYIFPLIFFSAINYRFIFMNFESTQDHFQDKTEPPVTIHIRSKLKKETLTFQSNELLYAVSEGNYIIFHLYREEETKKIPIRNSISNIESQLKDIDYFFRCHRGFIVNLKMVESKKGNSSGYLLKIKQSNDTIPVSRNKTKDFNQLMGESNE